MWYAIISEDKPGTLALRLANRSAHIERLEALNAAGRLLIAGPHPAIDAEDPGAEGFTGSLVVVSFDSLPQAQAWADEDPYLTGGVYERVTVKPFRKVLP